MGLFHKHKERAALEDLHICFVCDAGMGSSAMAAGQLQKKLKAHPIITLHSGYRSSFLLYVTTVYRGL